MGVPFFQVAWVYLHFKGYFCLIYFIQRSLSVVIENELCHYWNYEKHNLSVELNLGFSGWPFIFPVGWKLLFLGACSTHTTDILHAFNWMLAPTLTIQTYQNSEKSCRVSQSTAYKMELNCLSKDCYQSPWKMVTFVSPKLNWLPGWFVLVEALRLFTNELPKLPQRYQNIQFLYTLCNVADVVAVIM